MFHNMSKLSMIMTHAKLSNCLEILKVYLVFRSDRQKAIRTVCMWKHDANTPGKLGKMCKLKLSRCAQGMVKIEWIETMSS